MGSKRANDGTGRPEYDAVGLHHTLQKRQALRDLTDRVEATDGIEIYRPHNRKRAKRDPRRKKK